MLRTSFPEINFLAASVSLPVSITFSTSTTPAMLNSTFLPSIWCAYQIPNCCEDIFGCSIAAGEVFDSESLSSSIVSSGDRYAVSYRNLCRRSGVGKENSSSRLTVRPVHFLISMTASIAWRELPPKLIKESFLLMFLFLNAVRKSLVKVSTVKSALI